jgi:polyisoprenoid-binding protein YceI
MNTVVVLCCLSVMSASSAHGVVGASVQDSSRTYRIVPGLSQASYAVDEVFFDENNRLFTAVGTSTAVSGTIIVDASRPSASRIEEIMIDLRQLQSDSERRDRALREKYLDTRRYPFARLTRGVLAGVPPSIASGRTFTYTIDSDLTLHGTTRHTRWRGEATVVGDTLRAMARTEVKMSAFGIEVPSLLSLRSDDDVKLEVRVVAVASPSLPHHR